MVHRVTVALVGDPKSPPPGMADLELAWEVRPQIELDVESEESLASILDRAGAEFGAVPFQPGGQPSDDAFWIALAQPSHQPLWELLQSELTVLDEHGEALWVADWKTVQYDQLQRSVDAGVIAGDASRIYYIRQVPQGDGSLGVESWRLFLELWELIRIHADDGTDAVVDIGEIAGGLAVIWAGIKVARRRFPRWMQRGATPANLDRALVGTMDENDAAERLGCSPEEAIAVIAMYERLRTDDRISALYAEMSEVESLARSGMYDYGRYFLDRLGKRPDERPVPEQYAYELKDYWDQSFELPRVPEDDTSEAWEEEGEDVEWRDYEALYGVFAFTVILLVALTVALGVETSWPVAVALGFLAALGTASVFAIRPVRRRIGPVAYRLLRLSDLFGRVD